MTSTLRSLSARLWPHGFIAVFVAVQLALPLHYYLVRDDHHDERFAWRMFSSTRMLTCTVELRVDDQPVDLTATFHDAWQALARRGRQSVVIAMGEHLCKQHPEAAVRATMTCQPLRGERYTVGHAHDICTVHEL